MIKNFNIEYKNDIISGKYQLVDRLCRPCKILSWKRYIKPINYNLPAPFDIEYPIVYECIETGLISCVDNNGKVYHTGNNENDLFIL